MGCQKKITHTIIEEKADYVLQVKDNQQRLHEDIALFFQDTENGAFDTCETIDGDHGRIETRQYYTTSDIDWLPGKHLWAGIKTIPVLSPTPSGNTGASKTACTGAWTSRSEKTTAGYAKTMRLKI
jgi:hypothetical protein